MAGVGAGAAGVCPEASCDIASVRLHASKTCLQEYEPRPSEPRLVYRVIQYQWNMQS